MSKLSFQFIGADSDDTAIVARLAAARPSVFKSVNAYHHAHVMHAASPGTLVIIRDMVVGESLMEGLDPAAVAAHDAARIWFDAMLPFMQTAPFAAFEGGFNEWGDWGRLEWLSDFETERQRLMAGAGLRACIGNFSAHSMLFSMWQRFQPALDSAVRGGNVLGLHGYYAPDLRDEGHQDYLFPYRALRAAAGAHCPPVVLTEFGIDNALLPGRDFDGWQTVPNLTAQGYLDELAWADSEMGGDAICLGACVYLWTGWEGVGDYSAYNIAKPRMISRREADPSGAVGDLLIKWIADHPPAIVELPPSAPPTVPAPVPPYYATVTGVLNVRLGRADADLKVGQVRPGDVVRVLDDSGPRAVIDFPLETSVLKDYLTPAGG